jgi:hypothetical protein
MTEDDRILFNFRNSAATNALSGIVWQIAKLQKTGALFHGILGERDQLF